MGRFIRDSGRKASRVSISQVLLAAFASLCLILFPITSSYAAVSPMTGPTSGGTNVTIDGIKFVKVSAGVRHALGLTSEGTVFSWGINSNGELGDGTTTNRSIPVQVKGVGGIGYLTGVTDISAGGWYSLALVSGNVVSWGINTVGTLGNGGNTNSLVPVFVSGVGGTGRLAGITSISAERNHALATDGNHAYSWGSNFSGQLGNNQVGVDSNCPVIVLDLDGSTPLTGVSTVAAGSADSLAIVGGYVYAWGGNYLGELGDNTTTLRPFPVKVLGPGGIGFLSGISMIAQGDLFSLASSGTSTYAWGNNGSGALGDGSTTNSYFPVQVLGVGGSGQLSGVTALGTGFYQSLALTSSGAVAWGSNVAGSLGNNSTTPSPFPVQVLGLSGQGNLTTATSIDGGEYFSLATTPSGVLGWGQSYSILLGDGGVVSSSRVPILGPNFQPASVMFGSAPAQNMNSSSSIWNVVSPSGTRGAVTIQATANLFGGTTPGSPSSVSWAAGNFTYQPALANTGAPNNAPVFIGSGIAVLLGIGLLIALRRQNRN